MNPVLDRAEAIEVIALNELREFSAQEKYNTLLDYWTIDIDDPHYNSLPAVLRDELATRDAPRHEVDDECYTPLLLHALQDRMKGIRNEYLAKRLLKLGKAATVVGDVEELEPCPCCRYRTLTNRADLSVCPVCLWEDDGTDSPERYSDPNHMTLSEARANFRVHGVVALALASRVAVDAQERYFRDASDQRQR